MQMNLISKTSIREAFCIHFRLWCTLIQNQALFTASSAYSYTDGRIWEASYY